MQLKRDGSAFRRAAASTKVRSARAARPRARATLAANSVKLVTYGDNYKETWTRPTWDVSLMLVYRAGRGKHARR